LCCLSLLVLCVSPFFLPNLYTDNGIILIVATGEVGGFGARIASHLNNEAWAQYITQGVLLLVGPLFFAATIYMMLGRTIRLAGGEDVSLIPARWYTRIFVTADVTTLIIQGLGKSRLTYMDVYVYGRSKS
jgi:hypothetical protein